MLLLLTLLEHLLHNLLLLDQKRPDHPILDAIRTSRSSVRALDGFLGLGDVGVFAGPEGGDLLCLWNTLAPHLPRIYIYCQCRYERDVVGGWEEVPGEGGLTPGSLIPQSPHLGGLPRFLMCWYWSFPPGVLTTRTLLERVLYLYIIMNGQPWPHICRGFCRGFCVEKACRWW